MLNDFSCSCPVYIACGYTDLRRGIDGLATLVKSQFQMDPFQRALFLFCGRRRDRIKALYWEENFYSTEVLPQEKTIYRLFKPQTDMMHSYNTPAADDLIVNLKENLDILCGDLNLVLVNKVSDHTFVRRIRNFIEDNHLRDKYDYVIIDWSLGHSLVLLGTTMHFLRLL